MKIILRISSWFCLALGVLAIIGSLSDASGSQVAGFLGGGLFAFQGLIALLYIRTNK